MAQGARHKVYPPPPHKVGTRFLAEHFGDHSFSEQPYIYILCLIERVAVSYLVQEVVRGGCAGRLCGILGGCAGRLCGRVFRMHIPLKHMLLFSKALHFVELS